MKRREFIKTAVAAAAIGTAINPGTAHALDELRLLTWEGYAEDAWIKPFEAAHNVKVTKTYVGSNDEYMAKLAAGGVDFDLVVIVCSLSRRAIAGGFLEPLNPALLPNLSELYPEVRQPNYNMAGDTLYGASTFLSIQPVTVNAQVVDGNDFGVLFDKRYAGKIAMWDDVSSLGDVANWLGIEDIWNMTDEQLDIVKRKMIEQKALVRTYWSQAGELIDLFASGEVVASNSWSYVNTVLRQRNFPVRDFTSKPPIGGMDSHFIVKGSSKVELAHQFINHMLSAETQAAVIEATGYLPSNGKVAQLVKPEIADQFKLAAIPEQLRALKWWDDIPRRGRYLEVLNEIKSA